MSDLFGNHIVGFPTWRLISWTCYHDITISFFLLHVTGETCDKYMSHLVGKPTICIGENKDADQLRGNREADQCLCFRYSDSRIPLLLKSEISSFLLFSVLLQAGLCQTCSETTLLFFPRGGSYVSTNLSINNDRVSRLDQINHTKRQA